MTDILIIYSSTDGHTLKICQRIKQIIEQQRHGVSLMSVDDEMDLRHKSFDKILIGASIRYGKHSTRVRDFIVKNRRMLESRPNGFFSVNLVARKPDKNQPHTNPYFRKFLHQVGWQPQAQAVFAGKIDYRKYHFLDRQIIRFIMWLTHGPTRSDACIEFTDWQQVEAFAKRFCDL